MTPGGIERLVQELRRRRVFRGIVVYGASTLLILEAADVIFSAFGIDDLPSWLIILLGIGFLGSLWFSWIFDFTPGGIVKTEPADDHPAPIPNQKLNTYRLTTFISVAIILGLVSFRIIDRFNVKKMEEIEKSIAVLPLSEDYRGPEISSDYEQFVGFTITSCLLKVRNYRIIPWEDSRKYPREGRRYDRIGSDLSAAILVDWRPLEIKLEKFLSVSLIAAQDGNSIWSDQYKIENDWSSSEISRCSRKISKKITRKLRTFLTLEERTLLSEEPISPRATMLASLGNAMVQDAREQYHTVSDTYDTLMSEYIDAIRYEKAIQYFTEAIKEDSTLAEAYANRAKAKLWGMRINYFDNSILEECESDITTALHLKPELPEAHVAMGFYHYYGHDEYKLATVSFDKAVDLRPNNPEYLFYLSLIWRRLGEWDKVRPLIDRVFESNPRNVLFQTNLGISYLYFHDFSRSIECQERAINLIPEWMPPHISKANAFMWKGEMKKARKVLHEAERITGNRNTRILAQLDLYEENFDGAVINSEEIKDIDLLYSDKSLGDNLLLRAKIQYYSGNRSKARLYYEQTVDFFTSMILINPEDYWSLSRLGIAYAGTGKFQQAIDHGQKALDLITRANDGLTYPAVHLNSIRIYAMSGQNEIALRMIKEHTNIPSPYTLEFFKLDPYIKHLFDDTGS